MIVAVLSGGRSSEHDVSIASAPGRRAGLEAAGHEVRAGRARPRRHVALGRRELALQPGRGLLDADVAFPVLHGPFGEDGTVQGLLELLDVAYVGRASRRARCAWTSSCSRTSWRASGIPQVAYGGPARRASIGWPRWVKPARLGRRSASSASTGPRTWTGRSRPRRRTTRASSSRRTPGLEVETSVLGDQASVPGEISLTGDGWYDYEAKYTPGGMELVVPARISDTAQARVQELAVPAFQLAGCDGLARVDFFVDGEDVLLNELNTMPGMTETSVWGKLWEAERPRLSGRLDRLCRPGGRALRARPRRTVLVRRRLRNSRISDDLDLLAVGGSSVIQTR